MGFDILKVVSIQEIVGNSGTRREKFSTGDAHQFVSMFLRLLKSGIASVPFHYRVFHGNDNVSKKYQIT